MNGFDPQRSTAIRDALVLEATPTRRRRPLWRGAALLLAGVLVGSGATTAAFANSRNPLASPSPEQSPGAAVDVPGTSEAFPSTVEVATDPTTGKLRVVYRADQGVRELSTERIVVRDSTVLRFVGRPAEATAVWASFSCRKQGGELIVEADGTEPLTVRQSGAGGAGGADEPGRVMLATMLSLSDPPPRITPAKGCVAEVELTYYAKK